MTVLDTDLTNHVMRLMGIILRPAKEHHKLTDSIGEIIRSTNLSDEEKIDKISDLFL